MEKKEVTRTSKRREKVHNEILNVAAKLISEKGSSAVSIEEIAAHADVARKTLYNHFDNKEALIKELVLPICNHAVDYLKRTENEDEFTLDHIWSYCLELWNKKDLNITLLYKVNVDDYSDINESKHGFVIVFMKLLKRIKKFEINSDVELKNYAEIIYMTYMPLLESLSNQNNFEERFKNGMTGLINGLTSI